MNPKWSSKFELKPGKWVFVPTPDAIESGLKIKQAIEACWKPPKYYFHLRAGGHVEAMRSHLTHDNFLHIDIQDFFGSIGRTRVIRCLKSKFPYTVAHSYAHASTVPNPAVAKQSILPFGFVQSQIIAAVCFFESALGIYLDKLSANPQVGLSVYVDDIIISASNINVLTQVLDEVCDAAKRARFQLNAAKQQGPAASITAFNIVLAKDSLAIDPTRLKRFEDALLSATSKHQREGIISYVSSVNTAQGIAISI